MLLHLQKLTDLKINKNKIKTGDGSYTFSTVGITNADQRCLCSSSLAAILLGNEVTNIWSKRVMCTKGALKQNQIFACRLYSMSRT